MPAFVYFLLAFAFLIALLLVIGMCRVSADADRLMEEEHQRNRNNEFRNTMPMRFGRARYDDRLYNEG